MRALTFIATLYLPASLLRILMMFDDLLMSFQLVLPRKASLVCTSRQVTLEAFLVLLHVRSAMRALAVEDRSRQGYH